MATFTHNFMQPYTDVKFLNKKLMNFKSPSSFSSYTTSSPMLPSISVRASDHSLKKPVNVRRSGNYKPAKWDFDFIQSLNTQNYMGERWSKRASELKELVKMMLENIQQDRIIDQLEFIDDLQRLGVSYHFEDDINQILTRIFQQKRFHITQNSASYEQRSLLYVHSLEFRLLRQHGFEVPEEIFDCFKNEKGRFKTELSSDPEGLLQLYEASHLQTEGESTLELAREFSTICLHKFINLEGTENHEIDQHLGLMVRSALELPLHWRAERPYARWFIHAYETRPVKNNLLVEFAKLDFNSLQETYQQELKHVSRWWKDIGLAEKLPFARDSLVESYIWTIGGFSKPQEGYSRIICTKVITLLTAIDDIYDVYGTLEELEIFTHVIQRWDIEKIQQLPEYMQRCFSALNKFIDEMATDVLKTQGFLIIPYLRKSWVDLCTAYLQEARWYFSGYTPRFEEYMDNAWISVALPAVLCHAYFTIDPVNEDPQCLNQDIVRWTSMIIRLADDLGTSPEEMKRGDVPKTIQCYMNETGANEEEAQEHIRFLTQETWKKINTSADQEQLAIFPDGFKKNMIGLGRMAQCIYLQQNGDGNTYNNKDHFPSLIFQNIA